MTLWQCHRSAERLDTVRFNCELYILSICLFTCNQLISNQINYSFIALRAKAGQILIEQKM